jgi:type I site-specific restriction endonuclease
MASIIESGMSTYLAHFQQLINVCMSFGARYNPQTFALQIMNLALRHHEVQNAVNLVDSLLPDYIAAESERLSKFAGVPELATRVQASAIALKLPPAIIIHIREVVRKIRGARAKAIKPVDLTDPDAKAEKHISVSQTSFNEQIEHFNQLIQLVASQSQYTPYEEDLLPAQLTAILNSLRTTNDAVMQILAPLTAARQARNALLFAPETGMIDIALAVKQYVESVFGAKSPQYKEVNHIKFKNRKI